MVKRKSRAVDGMDKSKPDFGAFSGKSSGERRTVILRYLKSSGCTVCFCLHCHFKSGHFSRDEAKQAGLQLQKQSSSFVDTCRAGGRKCQEPRGGHLGRVALSHYEWWQAQTVCCVAHHRDVCR